MSTHFPFPGSDEESMVMEYLHDGSELNKQKAVEVYLPLVKHIVGRMQLPDHSPFKREDIIQFGIVGLLDALDRFQPNNGATFKTYAYRRIYGEIVDAFRREGNLTRDQISVSNRVGKTMVELRSKFGREPTAYEICEEAGITEEEYAKVQESWNSTFTLSLDRQILLNGEETIFLKDTIADETQEFPDEQMIKTEIKNWLKRYIKKLPERQRIIIALYYYEELTFADIGQVLGISESRVCQIHNKTISEIRSKLNVK